MVNKKDTKPTEKKVKTGKKPHGRPSLLTDEVVEKILQAIGIGSSYELASRYAGISYPTLQNWLRIGRTAKAKAENEGEDTLTPEEKTYLTFLRHVEEAEGLAGISWQQVVFRSSRSDPVQAMGMLRMRFSGYTIPTPVNFTANIDYSKLTDDQLQRLANGEDPAVVLADSSGGGSGTPPAAKP